MTGSSVSTLSSFATTDSELISAARTGIMPLQFLRRENRVVMLRRLNFINLGILVGSLQQQHLQN
jgi:hypothetical protein